MKRLNNYCAVIAVLLSFAVPAAASKAPAAQENWLSVSLLGAPAGYVHLVSQPAKGVPGAVSRLSVDGLTQLNLMGVTVRQEQKAVTFVDADQRPLTESVKVSSNGSELAVDARYDYTRRVVRCSVRMGTHVTEKTLAMPPGATFAAGDSDFPSVGRALKVGTHETVYYLNPLSVALETEEVAVTGQEEIVDPVDGAAVTVFVVTAKSKMGNVVTRQDKDGRIYRADVSAAGIMMSMRRCNEATATDLSGKSTPGGRYLPPPDLAVESAVDTDTPLADARRITLLRATVSGLGTDERIINDPPRQNVVSNVALGTVNITIQVSKGLMGKGAQIPVTDPALFAYLKETSFVDFNNEGIRQTAARLKGRDSNLYTTAKRIRNWTHAVMTPDAGIGVPRAASDIYSRRRGVCRDYATLFAAVARAAGIPTRVCGGLVYADGKFYRHAWDECWTGSWQAFDPTLFDPDAPVEFTDATHIKLAEGDPADVFGAMGTAGRLHIKILETQASQSTIPERR